VGCAVVDAGPDYAVANQQGRRTFKRFWVILRGCRVRRDRRLRRLLLSVRGLKEMMLQDMRMVGLFNVSLRVALSAR
jgi:hypothetical protein